MLVVTGKGDLQLRHNFLIIDTALRNVIERSFGVLKRRFAILRGVVPNYTMTTQINIIIACCVMHNFIRDPQPNDMYFTNLDEGDPVIHGAIPPYLEIQSLHSPLEVVEQWIAMRDTMATHMFIIYRNTRNRARSSSTHDLLFARGSQSY